MANCQINHRSLSQGLQKEFSRNFNNNKASVGFSRKFGQRNNNGYYYYSINYPLKCCSSSTSQGAEQVEVKDQYGISRNENFGYLLSSDGWQVRRMVENEDEMREVARVQAEAFHEPVILFNDMFYEFFQAEVLAGLLYRLRNSPPDRYACLVAEDRNEYNKEVVGVVDATVNRDDDVFRHLPKGIDDEYLYISGIAVLRKFRRQKVATALLKACEMVANLWGFEYLVLRAYEDDYGARKLYSNAGYKVVSTDPPWLSSWIGRRRRVLMIKRNVLD